MTWDNRNPCPSLPSQHTTPAPIPRMVGTPSVLPVIPDARHPMTLSPGIPKSPSKRVATLTT